MTGHDGARGLIVGTDLPLFVSRFCIFAHTFASQMRRGRRMETELSQNPGDSSWKTPITATKGRPRKQAEQFKTGDTIACLLREKMPELTTACGPIPENVSPASGEASKPNWFSSHLTST